MTPLLSLSDVKVRHGLKIVLDNISMAAAHGERVALLGLNGSGKTSLLQAIAGLLPFEGDIKINGVSLNGKTAEKIREKTGFLFSEPENQILFPRVADDVAFGFSRMGMPENEAFKKAGALLHDFGIGHLAGESPYHISHGEIQRVALAGTIAGSPELLLLDEPSSALDPVGKKSLAELLKKLESAMIIATHDIDFAKATCRRFIVLDHGKIVKDQKDTEGISEYWISNQKL